MSVYPLDQADTSHEEMSFACRMLIILSTVEGMKALVEEAVLKYEQVYRSMDCVLL